MIRYSNLLDYLIGNYLPILLINYWKIYKLRRKIRYAKKFYESLKKKKKTRKILIFIQINIGTNCENKRVTGYSKIEIESL